MNLQVNGEEEGLKSLASEITKVCDYMADESIDVKHLGLIRMTSSFLFMVMDDGLLKRVQQNLEELIESSYNLNTKSSEKIIIPESVSEFFDSESKRIKKSSVYLNVDGLNGDTIEWCKYDGFQKV